MTVQFTCTKKEAKLIAKIAKRAVEMGTTHGIEVIYDQIEMDITACHCNGCPLDLQKLLDFSDVNFGHDVLGIRRYIDRDNGTLLGQFDPRCSMPQ